MKCCDMTPGMLRHTVDIQRQQKTPDGAGGFTRTWQTIATLRASIKALSGNERMHADRLSAETKNRVIMRYRPEIMESDRIVYRERAFNIRFIDNVEFRDRWLVIDVDGGVAT